MEKDQKNKVAESLIKPFGLASMSVRVSGAPLQENVNRKVMQFLLTATDKMLPLWMAHEEKIKVHEVYRFKKLTVRTQQIW